MRARFVLSLMLAAALPGCASTWHDPDNQSSGSSGNTFLAVVGTPFLIAFKIPFCVASVVVAAPLAGVTGLSPDPDSRETQQALGDGVAQNCGAPWVLSP